MIANGQYTAQDGTQKTNWKQAGMIGVSANGKVRKIKRLT